MAEDNTTDMGAFFAKKKGKKKFGSKKKSPATNIVQTLAAESNVEKEKVEVDSGWLDNVEEKKAIINTSGKSVVDLSDDKAPAIVESKETGNKFNMEETKNIFQNARASAQQKGDTEEVTKEPVKKYEEMTWKEKMELRKKNNNSTGPIKVDDERHFPTLGGKSTTAETAGGAWGTFVTAKDDTGGQDADSGGDNEGLNDD